jgi:hypothetical protein
MIAAGMWLQSLAIALFIVRDSFTLWLLGAIALGAGTALVYPTLLAAIGDVVDPRVRSSSVGVYRLWRDSGYAFEHSFQASSRIDSVKVARSSSFRHSRFLRHHRRNTHARNARPRRDRSAFSTTAHRSFTLMIFRQILRSETGCASYVFG